MASISDIANMALGHVGDDTRVVNIVPPNIDKGTAPALCSLYWPIARRTLIEQFPWRFATTRAALSQVAITDSTWSFGYTLPSDRVIIVKVLSGTTFMPTDSLFSERGGAIYDIQDGTLYTNEDGAVLLYRKDVIDPTKYTPSFVMAASYMLAALLAGPIVKGSEGIKLGQSLREVGLALGRSGAVLDTNSTQDEGNLEFTPSSVSARQ